MELVKMFLKWLQQIHQEPSGKFSWKRSASSLLLLVFSVAYLHIAIPKQELIDIPQAWATLIGAIILGLGFINRKANNDKES